MITSKVLQVADSLKYVREYTNHNDHPAIDKMLAFLGLPKGLSWCLAFCLWCYHAAAPSGPFPFPKIARCSTFWEQTTENPLRYKTFTPEDVAWKTEKLQPGDIGIFSHNADRKKNWEGHAVLVVKDLGKGKISTIEGNTMPGPGGNQREGGGVYYRTRQAGVKGLWLEGFVRKR